MTSDAPPLLERDHLFRRMRAKAENKVRGAPGRQRPAPGTARALAAPCARQSRWITLWALVAHR